jgi:hypothetical protein
LKLRNFTLGRKLEDKEVVGDSLKHIVDLLGDLRPWVSQAKLCSHVVTA